MFVAYSMIVHCCSRCSWLLPFCLHSWVGLSLLLCKMSLCIWLLGFMFFPLAEGYICWISAITCFAIVSSTTWSLKSCWDYLPNYTIIILMILYYNGYICWYLFDRRAISLLWLDVQNVHVFLVLHCHISLFTNLKATNIMHGAFTLKFNIHYYFKTSSCMRQWAIKSLSCDFVIWCN